MRKKNITIKALAGDYFSGLKNVLDGLDTASLERVASVLTAARKGNKRIFVMGNGGSGATASHFACDVNKGASGGKKKRFKIFCLNDNVPTIMAYANDCSYSSIFVEQLKNFLEPRDVVIGISSSGNSVNVLKAIEYSNRVGARTIGLAGFSGGRLAKISVDSIIVPSCDVQKIEDAHLVIVHVLMQYFCKN